MTIGEKTIAVTTDWDAFKTFNRDQIEKAEAFRKEAETEIELISMDMQGYIDQLRTDINKLIDKE